MLFKKRTGKRFRIEWFLLVLCLLLIGLTWFNWENFTSFVRDRLVPEAVASFESEDDFEGEVDSGPDLAVEESTRERTLFRPVVEAAIPEEATSSEPNDAILAEARRRAEEDPAAAMEWIQSEEISHAQRLRAMLEVVAVWAAEDSEGALLWVESNAQGLARLETLESGMELWSREDPVSASQWVDGMANDQSKSTAAKALVENWARQSPEAASQWINEMSFGPIRDEAAVAMVQSWAKDDPSKAAAWAMEELRRGGNPDLLQESVEAYVRSSPAEAEQFVRGLSDADEAADSLEIYVRSFAEQDPEALADWMSGLTIDDPLKEPDNARVLMEEWSQTDSVAASSWLITAPLGPERDAAIIGFTNSMAAFEPEAASAWSNEISDPALRVETLFTTVENWAQTNPVEALEWVKTADLEPALRDTLAVRIAAD